MGFSIAYSNNDYYINAIVIFFSSLFAISSVMFLEVEEKKKRRESLFLKRMTNSTFFKSFEDFKARFLTSSKFLFDIIVRSSFITEKFFTGRYLGIILALSVRAEKSISAKYNSFFRLFLNWYTGLSCSNTPQTLSLITSSPWSLLVKIWYLPFLIWKLSICHNIRLFIRIIN